MAEERTAPVLVVDRPGWIRATPKAFSALIEPAGRQDRRQARCAVPGVGRSVPA
ncbi:MAG: hypothetical protein R2734_03895 [Nocardioides sp.]